MHRKSITGVAFLLRDSLVGSTGFLFRASHAVCFRRCGWSFVTVRRIKVSIHGPRAARACTTEGRPDVSPTDGDSVNIWDETDGDNTGRVIIPDGAKLMDAVGPSDVESPLERMLQNLRFNYESIDVCKTENGPAVQNCKSFGTTGKKLCIRYRCHHGHVIRCLANSPATRECPSCNVAHVPRGPRGKLSLFELRQTARENGGTLISTEYVNARTPITWRCRHGHVWRASACNVRNGRTWCPECARQRRKLGLTDMHKLAAKFGGECLSNQYISQYVKLQWRCGRGHTFWLAPNNIARSPGGKRKPTWCKICRRMDGDAAVLGRTGHARSTPKRRRNSVSTGRLKREAKIE